MSWISCVAPITQRVRAAFNLEASDVADPGGDGQCFGRGTIGQCRDEFGHEVNSVDVVSAAREVQSDAAGAGAQLENRVAVGGRQLLPRAQVVRVATALDVVPDGLVHAGSV